MSTSQVHSFQLENRLREATEVAAPRDGGGGISEEELAAKIEAAVAEVQADADDGMNDLLVCLGQEEQKVER
jgi:hypothetical protein